MVTMTKDVLDLIIERELPGYYRNMTYDAASCWLIQAVKKDIPIADPEKTKRVFIRKDTNEVVGISAW